MSNLTEARNTPALLGPMCYVRRVAAGSTVFAGGLTAQSADGTVKPAGDAAGLIVLGRAENTAVSGEELRITTGLFIYDNGAGAEALDLADIGNPCYALDDHTVGAAGGTNKVKAGIVKDITPEGVIVEIN